MSPPAAWGPALLAAERRRGAALDLQPVVNGQIKLRRIDGWRKIAVVLSEYTTVAA
jgi:hypothetical protein